jgi:hypothetical protein
LESLLVNCNAGYGVCSGLQTQGNFGCPPCGPEGIQTQGRSSFLKKVIYMGARRFLPVGHELRKAMYNKFFNGEPERRTAPERPSGRYWEEQWRRVQENIIPLNRSGMTQLPGFYRLPYFKVCATSSKFCLGNSMCYIFHVLHMKPCEF